MKYTYFPLFAKSDANYGRCMVVYQLYMKADIQHKPVIETNEYIPQTNLSPQQLDNIILVSFSPLILPCHSVTFNEGYLIHNKLT